MVIPCLCSFTALRTLAAEPLINKKRTRTLFHKESGSSTNCMVDRTDCKARSFLAEWLKTPRFFRAIGGAKVCQNCKR